MLFDCKPTENGDALWAMYKRAENCFWFANELSPVDSRTTMWTTDRANDGTRLFLTRVCQLLSRESSELDDPVYRVLNDQRMPRAAKFFYDLRTTTRNVHSRIFSRLADMFNVFDVTTTAKYRGMSEPPETRERFEHLIREKEQWLQRSLDRADGFLELLAVVVIFDSLLHAGTILVISIVSRNNCLLLPTYYADLLTRDRCLHRDFGCTLFRSLNTSRASVIFRRIAFVVQEAVQLEETTLASICDSANDAQTRRVMECIEESADTLLIDLGFEAIYKPAATKKICDFGDSMLDHGGYVPMYPKTSRNVVIPANNAYANPVHDSYDNKANAYANPAYNAYANLESNVCPVNPAYANPASANPANANPASANPAYDLYADVENNAYVRPANSANNACTNLTNSANKEYTKLANNSYVGRTNLANNNAYANLENNSYISHADRAKIRQNDLFPSRY